MAEQFYTILTQIGKAKMANASALGNKVEFKYFALGDGNGSYYNPTESQTELKKEVWRGTIGQIVVDENNPNWIVLETVIPADQGGFTIREAGVFDVDGNLLAIGKYPETYKPLLENGSAKDLYIRMILEVTNTSVVNLKVDPSIILATKKDIDILSNRITKNESDIAELKQGSTTIGDLQTENKTLAGAINELEDNKASKDYVDDAIDELFQSVSNGKNVIATAITDKGIITSSDDTFQNMADNIGLIETGIDTSDATALAGDILSGKIAYGNEKIIGTMTNHGTVNKIITSQDANYYIPKGFHSGAGIITARLSNLLASNIKEGVNVGGIIGTLATGKKYASGTVRDDGRTALFKQTRSDLGDIELPYVTVTGLTFKPSIIIIKSPVGSDTIYHTHDTSSSYFIIVRRRLTTETTSDTFHNIRAVQPAVVTSSGFTLPIGFDLQTVDHRWYAYE